VIGGSIARCGAFLVGAAIVALPLVTGCGGRARSPAPPDVTQGGGPATGASRPEDRPAAPDESGPFAIPDPARAAASDSGVPAAASTAVPADSGRPAGEFVEPAAPASPPHVETGPSETTNFTFSVQIYAGHDVDRAEEVAGAARGRLPHPVIVDLVDDLYKVRVGECATRDEAFALLRIVRDSGYPDAWIVGIRRADAWRSPE
jgi:hypothetical protein